MKRIALLLWGLVLGLALLIWWQEQSARPVSAQAWLDRPLSLLRPAGAVLPEGARPEPVVAETPVKRVVPPAPGKMPTMISGRPILAFGLSAAMMRWQASGSSNPMPSAVPGRAATIGLPPFLVFASIPASSILRST